jgi:hypothetical protein
LNHHGSFDICIDLIDLDLKLEEVSAVSHDEQLHRQRWLIMRLLFVWYALSLLVITAKQRRFMFC